MLRPVLRNETRWTDASTILNRFVKFMSLKAIDHTDAMYAALMPTHLELLRIDSAVAELKLFMSMTKKLQTRNITMINVRYLFDAAILRHPFLDNFVGPTCKNVSSPMFESTIVKIQGSCENQLTPEERNQVLRLVKRADHAFTVDGHTRQKEDEFASEILKRQRVESKSSSSYVCTSFIVPTSNDVERLFSLCKRLYSPHRRALSPITLEILVYLRTNRHLWDQALVASVVHGNEDVNDEDIDEDDEDIGSDFE
ncbi:hypothetical protein DYB37_010708 [Aphanomyces astaci]|uniref:HAT C-terminal dimerisation domain-containing protein n=1 Tax=Aphanomyces astaci TaxID=112090 RepID=A0A3R7A3I7_APHAT|nr:hypothetical protein DYB35_013947 [Aphanomyces astaci]RHZ11594.1 hypothetical protein DYB37_010708 [Aphanomyces astaci]